MPSNFTFASNTIATPSYLTLAQLSKGTGPGVNDPAQFSAIAQGQAIESTGDVDVVAVTLIAGQSYSFDVDDGAGDAGGGSVDLQLDIIDQRGNLILIDDGTTGLDPGSVSTADPGATVTVNTTGTYYIAVHAAENDYVNGTFQFESAFGSSGLGGTGDYNLVISTAGLPAVTALTEGHDNRAFTSARDNVRGLGGNDVINLGAGADVATGQIGNDTLIGGDGDDELGGGDGDDRLDGNGGQDVMVGGAGRDTMYGGFGNDAASGGAGNDTIQGQDGNDILWGEGSDDSISGGAGTDFIRGGAGNDVLSGGAGADTFHFLRGESAFDPVDFDEDRISDFEAADVIDLSDVSSGTLTFRGTGAFTGAGQVRVIDYRDPAGNGYQEVRINLDADTSTNEIAFVVDTVGTLTLTAADFIL